MRLQDAITKFNIALQGTVSERTVDWYRQRFAPLKPLLPLEIEDISPDQLRSIFVELTAKNYSVYTLHGFLRAWRRLFRWAYLEGYIQTNPAARLKLPRLPDEPPKGIDDNDILKLLDACTNDRDRAIILFLADTGARLGGVAELQRVDLDIANRRALVREKGRKARFVYYGDATASALEKWLSSRMDDDPRVFPLKPDSIYSMLKRYAKRAGIDGRWNPHAFRHAFARRILANGGNLAQVSQLMGHSSVYVTVQFYGRFANHELQIFHRRYNQLPIKQEDSTSARP